MLVLAFMKCTNNFQDFLVDVSYCSSNAEGIAFLPFCKMQNNFQWLFYICSVSLTFSGREENMSTVHVQHATKNYFSRCDYVLVVFQQSGEKNPVSSCCGIDKLSFLLPSRYSMTLYTYPETIVITLGL